MPVGHFGLLYMPKHPINRRQVIHRIRSNLERNSYPRLQMLLLVNLTGVAGFSASYLLLRAGVLEMWLRYLASIGIAYVVFLMLLWLWLRTRNDDYAEVPDIPLSMGSDHTSYSGQGGEFGGGGASGSFDGPALESSLPNESGPLGDAVASAAEAEEFAIPLFAIILVAVLLMSSLLIVLSAPTLFAELLVDGVLSASLYRRLRGLQTRHWLETAFRRTAWSFFLTATLVSASGWGMEKYAPGSHSIGEVLTYARKAD